MNEMNNMMAVENEVAMNAASRPMGHSTAAGFAMGAGSALGVVGAVWGIKKLINYRKAKLEQIAKANQTVVAMNDTKK